MSAFFTKTTLNWLCRLYTPSLEVSFSLEGVQPRMAILQFLVEYQLFFTLVILHKLSRNAHVSQPFPALTKDVQLFKVYLFHNSYVCQTKFLQKRHEVLSLTKGLKRGAKLLFQLYSSIYILFYCICTLQLLEALCPC